MPKTLHGIVHGRSIELEEDVGIPDGATVNVVVTPRKRESTWGEGIARSAGVGSDVPGFDDVFDQVERERKQATFRESGE